MISGFRRDVDEICGLLGNYTALCGNYLPTFRVGKKARKETFFPGFLSYSES
jgi:hypothetical protein